MKIERLIAYLIWSIEHKLGPHPWAFWMLGDVWYKFWIFTPIEPDHSLCVFCRKYIRKEGLEEHE